MPKRLVVQSFLHGPVTLVEQGLTIINCQVEDESHQAHIAQIDEVTERGRKCCYPVATEQ